MNRQNIINRLLYLRNWEFINIFLMPACLYITLTSLHIRHWQSYAYSMFVICVILAQGVFYWHLKLQIIRRDGTSLPHYFYKVFSLFKWLNVFLLAIYPLLFSISKTTSRVDFQISVGSSAIYLFAILEHINYYYFQLSHDNMNDIRYLLEHRKIRRSPLYVDMQRVQK